MPDNPLTGLINELAKLPGIGQKSAQKLAFFFLTWSQNEIENFAEILIQTKKKIKYCHQCFNISFSENCSICSDINRNNEVLCIVAEPKDIFAIEKIGYKGKYHVLGGLISPIDGIHPETLRLKELLDRIEKNQIKELIIAINSSIEGEATILYLQRLFKDFQINITRLAHGLPMGSEIDYIDEITLKKAFEGRTSVSVSAV